MKKIMTFAIMAILLGGFTLTANAQPGKKVDPKTTTTETTNAEKEKKEVTNDNKTTKQAVNKATPTTKTTKPATNATTKDTKVTTSGKENNSRQATTSTKTDTKTTTPKTNGIKKESKTPGAKAEAKTAGKENSNASKQPKAGTGIKKESKSVSTKAEAKTEGKEAKPELKAQSNDNDKMLKDYENAVNECVSVFNKLQKDGGSKSLTAEFEKTLSRAEDLRGKIENKKDELNRTQVERLDKANLILSQVYIK